MIDLTKAEAQKGALDALHALIASKNRPIIMVFPKGKKGGEKGKLLPPKRIKGVTEDGDDVENEQQDGQEGQTKISKVPDGQQKSEDKANGQQNGDGENGNDFGKQTSAEKAKIAQDAKDEKDMANMRAEDEEAEKAQKAALLRGAKAADFGQLADDLYYALAAEVGETSDIAHTYEHGGDPVYDGTDFLMPQDEPEIDVKKPLLYVFIDQSGSFGPDLVQKAKNIVKALEDMVDDGQIMEPKYFVFRDNCVELGKGEPSGATGGWPECMHEIRKSLDGPIDKRCTNVLVLSDDDIQDQTN